MNDKRIYNQPYQVVYLDMDDDMWEDYAPRNIFVEGDIITYATDIGIFFEAEMVKVTCPICLEAFIGNKKDAGLFLLGHEKYHDHVDEQAENYGGV
jgi:hypothetical protein|tara:strand:- start:10052 stop:10339 length:288 start_codon:yes stop_codon:yes gene_type:complete